LDVRLKQIALNVVNFDFATSESRIVWMSVRTSPNSMSALESLTVSAGFCCTCKPIDQNTSIIFLQINNIILDNGIM